MYMTPPYLPLKSTHRSLNPLSYLLQEELVCSLPDVLFVRTGQVVPMLEVSISLH